MKKAEFRNKVIEHYQSTTGDYLDKDDYSYEPIINKIDAMYSRGLEVVEASEELDLFIGNM